MLTYSVLILVFAIFCNCYFGNNRASNLLVFTFTWSVCLILYNLDLSVFPDLSENLKLYIMSFMSLYIISYVSVYSLLTYSAKSRLNFQYIYRVNLVKLFFFLWALFLGLFLIKVSLTIGIANYLTSGTARSSIKDISETHGVNISYYMFAYLFLISCFYEGFNKVKITLTVLVSLSLVFTAAKMNFVVYCLLAYVLYINKSNVQYKKVGFQLLFLVVAFYLFIFVFSLFTGKVIDQNVGSAENIEDILQFGSSALLYPYNYLVGAVAALDEVFFHCNFACVDSDYMSNVLARIYRFGSSLGLNSFLPDIPSHNKPFVNINGINTNVYSFHYELIADFGIYGAILSASLLAFVHATLDFLSKRERIRFTLYALNSLIVVFTLLTVISFRYFNTIIMMCLFLFFIEVAFGKVIYKNSK